MSTKRTSQARALRKNQTETEAILWQHLRAHRFSGVKFRRQYPIGPYIADFCAPSCRLIVEVDGSGHEVPEQRMHDVRRDTWLSEQGWKVLRFWNNEVGSELEAVLEKIFESIPQIQNMDAEGKNP
ncbi:MAG: endonuclease domain-containing protein [Patescibacteria group bacterium]|jgi:very-short-patch-repair endonuclease